MREFPWENISVVNESISMDEQLHLELVATRILQAGLWPRLLKAAKLILKKKKSRWKLEKHIENDKKQNTKSCANKKSVLLVPPKLVGCRTTVTVLQLKAIKVRLPQQS